MNDTKIGIVGAGIAGLILAHGLKKEGIEFKIYEKSKEIKNNYIISLEHQTFYSIKSILPPNVFENLSKTYDPKKTTFYNIDTKLKELLVLKHDESSTIKLYYFEREFLIKMLSQELSIEYDKEVTNIQEENNKVNLEFGDGTKESFDILIAADGSKSTIREVLYPNKLLEINYRSIQGRTNQLFLGTDYLSDKVSTGAVLIYGDVCYAALDIYKFADKEDYIAWSFTAKSKLIDELNSPEELLNFIKLETKKWDPSIGEILYNADIDSLKIDNLKYVDSSLKNQLLKSDSKVLFLGDSAHATIPMKGSGALTAIQDSIELIIHFKKFKENGDFNEFKNYNSKVIPAGFDKIKESIKTKEFIFVKGNIAQMARNAALKQMNKSINKKK